MFNIENKKMIKISEQSSFLLNPNIAEIEKCISCNTSVIIFDNICEQTEILENLLSNTFINSIILVSKKKNNLSNKKLIYTSKINKKSIRLLSTNILILTNLNNNYEYSKFIVTNIFNLLKNAKKFNKNINNIICSIFNKSIYLEDIINCFTAILIEDRKKQYEFIYDTACDYLDNQFNKKNICDFKNNQCIANREKCTNHDSMGCCYSFEYAGFFDIRLVKNINVCKYMQNKTCSTKNITCKLYTCKYLKSKNIAFDSHKILILDCFLDKKQHYIIQSNFFRSREEILKKLEEKNNDLFFWYLFRRKYMIKN